MPRTKHLCTIIRSGIMDYDEALELQTKYLADVQAHPEKSYLVLLSHNHVYTLGRRGARENILASDDELARRGIIVRRIHRGGDVTYHGPGQVVGYPIISLTRHGLNIRGYFDKIERVILNVLALYRLEGRCIREFPGVWVGDEKVAAIGVGVKRWVAFHGFALNANPDMDFFRLIVPCGIRDKAVTSMARLLGQTIDEGRLVQQLEQEFLREFGLERAEPGDAAG